MPPSTKPVTHMKSDPRTFVKALPLPIPSQKGIKIQARSDRFFNPTLPTRDVVRQDNYTRRQHQQGQGFRCAANKPYEGLGDPFYLDHKKLILHALGQWEEGQEFDTSSSSHSEDESHNLAEENVKKQKIPANFVLRRSRKGLNTLNKEVSHARSMIRNVRLGHGLFQLLRKEREDKSNALHREERRRRKQQLNEWQPPRYDSSSEGETDDDLDEDVDLRNYMLSSTTLNIAGPESEFPRSEMKSALSHSPPSNSDGLLDPSKSRVAFQGVENRPTTTSEFGRSQCAPSARSARSRTSRGSSSRKLPAARPYTPQHSYIGSEVPEIADRQSLFRQLCVLFWLLEAMNIEAPHAMGPIQACWQLKEIGGMRTTVGKQQLEKKCEMRWKQFSTNQGVRTFKTVAQVLTRWERNYLNVMRRRPALTGKRTSVWRLGGKPRGRGVAGGPNSVTSIADLSESHLGPDHSSARGPHGRDSVIPEDSMLSHEQETGTDVTEEEDSGSKGPLRYLEEVYSLSAERDQSNNDTLSQHEALSGRSERSSSMSPGLSPQLTRRRDRRPPSDLVLDPNTAQKSVSTTHVKRVTGTTLNPTLTETTPTHEEILKFLESINRSEEDPRFHALAHPKEKISSKDLRADLNVRPKSTPAVLEYQASLPSNRVGGLARDQRQMFAEVTEEKALMMHDALEAKDRQRLRVLQNKFLHMPAGGCSFHRALGKMRSKNPDDEEMQEQRRRSSTTHQSWYVELLQNIPEDLKQDWSFQVIIEKLAQYGLLECYGGMKVDSSKQNAYKLLKVLSGLRDWEVCSPDICAAIEFCRDKICEMSVDEYEEWFRAQFPAILRPQTAPPASRRSRDKQNSAASRTVKQAPKSAPPGVGRSKTTL